MKILEFIPVIKKPERPLENVIYLENETENETLAHKIYRLKDYQADYYVFHHQDAVLETPETLEANLERMRIDNVGVAGVIGTLIMSTTCAWWLHQRGVVTVGAIMQGDGKGGAYPMLDGQGYRCNAVAVDGCWMVFSDEFINKYELHEYHWRFGYDTDACFQALRRGMNVGILDVRVKHDSQGGFDQKEFAEFQNKFLTDWKQHVEFPVIKQSRFF